MKDINVYTYKHTNIQTYKLTNIQTYNHTVEQTRTCTPPSLPGEHASVRVVSGSHCLRRGCVRCEHESGSGGHQGALQGLPGEGNGLSIGGARREGRGGGGAAVSHPPPRHPLRLFFGNFWRTSSPRTRTSALPEGFEVKIAPSTECRSQCRAFGDISISSSPLLRVSFQWR